ncbi:MAG: DUF1028 domain-containing protein [Planctomycetota bacterium]|nr:DUF1028 domain-containing protein [Planctomycetota bacterium]
MAQRQDVDATFRAQCATIWRHMDRLRLLVVLFVTALLTGTLNATWSIILINTRTGEIAIGSATCLAGFDLQNAASLVLVGRGAAAAQSFVDDTGLNRMLIFANLQAGTDPAQILTLLAAQDVAHQTRQYGIVDVQGRRIGFTGNQAGPWAGHLTGQVGTIVYAIQGNVLTGQAVCTAAETAVRNATGDMLAKLMAGMEAARSMGGDGRCSCSAGNPPGCGAPPATFTKSAHIGYMLVARPGDIDGTCDGVAGCANGRYYFNTNIAGQTSTTPDPVYQLRTAYLNFRLQQTLRPDHFMSQCSLEPPTLLADGSTRAELRIVLNDWRGSHIPFGGASVVVTPVAGNSAQVAIGSVVDHGDGSYTVPIGPSTTLGFAKLRVVVNDGQGPVQIGPMPEITVNNEGLWLSRTSLDVTAGDGFDAVLNGGQQHAGELAILLASASGSTPGLLLSGGLLLPLNPDLLTLLMVDWAASGTAPNLYGNLDAQGRRRSALQVPAGALRFLRGGRLYLAWATLDPINFTSNPAVLELR